MKQRRVYNPFYFIWLALKNMFRNRIMSVTSILVLTSCLILVGVFGLVLINLSNNLTNLKLLNELVVVIEDGKTDEELSKMEETLNGLDNVTSIKFISKAEAFEIMKDTYADAPEYFELLEQNGDNPFPDEFVVTYAENDRVALLEYEILQLDGVESVNDRADIASLVEKVKDGSSVVFIWLFALLFIVSLFVIFNTVKLAVQSRKSDIEVMRYIGATRLFITTPFVLEGVFIGLFSAIIAYFSSFGIYTYSAGEILKTFSGVIEIKSFASMALLLALAYLAMGIVTGVSASLLSIRKNLSK